MTFKELQLEARKWRERNFDADKRDAVRQVLGVAEEVGELSHAVLKMDQGIRGDRDKHMLDAADAIGDVVIYLTGVCDSLELSFQECVEDAWHQVRDRNWRENTETGVA